MDIRDLIILRQKAAQAQACHVAFGVNHTGDMWLSVKSMFFDKLTLDDLQTRLAHLCVPPKPATITLTFPFEVVEQEAKSLWQFHGNHIHDACKEAVKPWS